MSDNKRVRPTLRDVATAADVSVWTASNTFSHPERVAPPTRRRVLDAADALGYQGPNPGARALAMGRSHLVAFATAAKPEYLLSDPAASLLAQGVLTTCSRAGLSVVLSGEDDAPLVDGHIAFRAPPTVDRRPRVFVTDSDDADMLTVRPDLEPGLRLLADYLCAMGHRRVAVLSVPGDDERLKFLGRHIRIDGDLPVFRSSDSSRWPTRGAGEALTRRALRGEVRPTAIVALSDALAMGALDAAHAVGLDVPGDLTIVGIDDTPGSDAVGLTTVVVPYLPLGELAALTLISRIEHGAEVVSPPPLTTTLTIRRSSSSAIRD